MFKEGKKMYEVTKKEDGEIVSIIEKKILRVTKTKITTDDAEYDITGTNKNNPNIYLSDITEELSALRMEIRKLREYEEAKKRYFGPSEITRKFNIGDMVTYGGNTKDIVDEVFDDGIFYGFKGKESYKVVPWVHIFPEAKTIDFEVGKRNTERISFYNQSIYSILHKIYSWNVDINPYYQRDFVWSEDEEYLLIDSIFNGIEIGKFVFIDTIDDINKEYDYEVLDGKQRINTILKFYEDRISYNGKTFSQLSARDRNHFLDFSLSVGEVICSNEEQKLRYFLRLNRGGKVMSDSHIEKVKTLLSLD